MSERDKLNSALTRLIDESPCSYEVVISLLLKQVRWMLRARQQEHPTKRNRISRQQILADLKTLQLDGRL